MGGPMGGPPGGAIVSNEFCKKKKNEINKEDSNNVKEEENKEKGKEEKNVDEKEIKENKDTPGLVPELADKEQIAGGVKDAKTEELKIEEDKVNAQTNGVGAVTPDNTKKGEVKEGQEGLLKPNKMLLVPKGGQQDADILLARLNTRKLCQRLTWLGKEEDVETQAYPPNMTTEEIAQAEWQEMRYLRAPPVPAQMELKLFSPCPRAVTALASFPRSGNTLMRTLYERTTVRVTGSDMLGGLVKHDLIGEAAICTNKVQFVKTHFPERKGIQPFAVSRAVLLVRNPYDAIDSFFNLMMTGAHTNTIDDDTRERHAKVWEEFVLKEIQVWNKFHKFWLEQKIPLLLVRYEDLTRYPEAVMVEVLKFTLELKTTEFADWRVQRCIVDEDITKLGSYKPRSGGIGKSLSKYSPELLQKMNVGNMDMMKRLGYEEMLIPNKDSWNLEWDDDGAVNMGGSSDTEPVIINTMDKIARTKELHTNWREVKKQDHMTGKCPCCELNVN